MAIIADRQERSIECDDCHEVSGTYEKDDFGSMISDAQDSGWSMTKTRAGWKHFCPDCRTTEPDFD